MVFLLTVHSQGVNSSIGQWNSTLLNTNIYSHLDTSGGQSFHVYLYVVHFFNTSVNYISVTA
jgi:hypothetical protein